MRTMKRNIATRLLLLCSLGLGATACDLSDEEVTGTVDEEGCEHLMDTGGMSITAAMVGDNAPPTVDDDHTRYNIQLPSVGGGDNQGVVEFQTTAGVFVFFVDQNVPFEVQSTAGATIAAASRDTSSPACTLVRGRFEYNLPIGTYFVVIGPTQQSEIGMVIEANR